MAAMFMADLNIGDPQPTTADVILSYFEVRATNTRDLQDFVRTAKPGDWKKFEGLAGMGTDWTLTLVAIKSERPAS